MPHPIRAEIPEDAVQEMVSILDDFMKHVRSMEKTTGKILVDAHKLKREPVIKFAHDVFETLFPHLFAIKKLPELVSRWQKTEGTYSVTQGTLQSLESYSWKLRDNTRTPMDTVYVPRGSTEEVIRPAKWDKLNNLPCIIKKLMKHENYASYGVDELVQQVIDDAKAMESLAEQFDMILRPFTAQFRANFKSWTEDTPEGQAYKAERDAAFEASLAEIRNQQKK